MLLNKYPIFVNFFISIIMDNSFIRLNIINILNLNENYYL